MQTLSYFDKLVADFSALPQVDAILLGGSRGAGTADVDSDYDLYIYLNGELPVSVRKQITDRYCQKMELNNQFWETEDDGVLRDGVEIELIYRQLDNFEADLVRVVELYQASVGYSTCFWANLLDSKILFDRTGQAAKLQKQFTVPYPAALQQAIVDKNYPLLMAQIPAYYHQISKALKRRDLVSLNHRVAEFLASYFDLLFAINEQPHPGEKRLLERVLRLCPKRPVEVLENIQILLRQTGEISTNLLDTVQLLSAGMQQLLQEEGLLDE